MPASITSSRRPSDTPTGATNTPQQQFSRSQTNLAGLGSQFAASTPRSAAQVDEAFAKDFKKLTLANGAVRTSMDNIYCGHGIFANRT